MNDFKVNEMFEFLNNKTFTDAEGIEGRFVHEIREVKYPRPQIVQALIFAPTEKGKQSAAYIEHKQSMRAQDWTSDWTQSIAEYIEAAYRLGFKYKKTEAEIENDKRAIVETLREASEKMDNLGEEQTLFPHMDLQDIEILRESDNRQYQQIQKIRRAADAIGKIGNGEDGVTVKFTDLAALVHYIADMSATYE